MSNAVFSKAEEICTVEVSKPHVVVLGAGIAKQRARVVTRMVEASLSWRISSRHWA